MLSKVVVKQCLLHNVAENINKKYRNKKEKSLKMKRDVEMACQKVHKQGKIKVMVSM